MQTSTDQKFRTREISASELSLLQGVRYFRNRAWENWGRTARCQPEFSFYPQRVEDLIQIVDFARERGRQVRVAASGHSWSGLVPTDGILVFVHQLNKVTMDLSDESNPRVVIESGATVKEVNDVLEAHGYTLPLNVVLESVRFGGLIATGSHGSGWNNSTLSDLVHAIEIVTASGQLHKFQVGVDSDEVMNAARLNLGMFGIIYRITMNVQKSWVVHAQDQRLPIDQVLENLKERVLAHDNMDLFWWPFCNQFWVKTWQRTEGEITAKPRKSLNDKVGSAIGARFHNEMLRLQSTFPRLTPGLSRFTFKVTPSKGDKVVDIVEAIHYRRAIEVAKMGCVEVAFKIDSGFDNVKWAIQAVMKRVEAYAQRGEYPMNVTMNVRFIHNSNCLLSPAFGEGHTCYIEILSRTNQADWESFSGEVASEWLTLPQARPHWAKEFQHIPNVIQHIKSSFGENIRRFNQIKDQLQVDPTHMFVNHTLEEIFLK
ncbi:MAG: FAD-binding protein [Anaerolineae bacterium]|nr:FAD-binding protein [Anaerolineae bacterium]MCI0609971.1 FAD-binding protein [Anaerolineae bacterium]